VELTKPKVSLLIVFTAIVGMVLASPGMVPLPALVFGTLGIALASGPRLRSITCSIGASMSTWRAPAAGPADGTSVEESRAGIRERARRRLDAGPVADGGQAHAILTFFSLIGYAVVYTLWLKRATPQNIVIGGAAGAAPPVLGWAAVTNTIDPTRCSCF